jgi:electron transport complex protein RnfG
VVKFITESWLVLALGVIFAALLAGAQVMFLPEIEKNERAVLNDAIAAVVPAGNADLQRRTYVLEDQVGKRRITNTVYEVYDDEGTIGWAVTAEGPGFVDVIGLVVGLAPELDQITGIKVIRTQETPGLGDKILDEDFTKWFQRVDVDEEIHLAKGTPDSAANEVQAITGATYSSEYVKDIVSDVLTRIRPKIRELTPADAREAKE